MKTAGFRDTTFGDNNDWALNRLAPWIASFSASFVDGVLEKVRSKRSSDVLALHGHAVDRHFAAIAEIHRFRVEGLHEVRKKRTGNSTVKSAVRAGTVKSKIRFYETAVELRAPGR
jgi:hypothetical protein